MSNPRGSGVLLHVTSLPGPFGIGGLGGEACAFLDFLAASGQTAWQVLPVGPTGYGDSPYGSLSAFAGNPLLVDPLGLVACGLLEEGELQGGPPAGDRVDYGAIQSWKDGLFRNAFARLLQGELEHMGAIREALEAFRGRHAHWLDDYALFMAIKDHHGDDWPAWEPGLRNREPEALARAAEEWSFDVGYHAFVQHLFFSQWGVIRAHAQERGIRLVGDLPLFVAHHSADVWSRRDLFLLDEQGIPLAGSGVPDQSWGHPLYRWEAMAADGFGWWVGRMAVQLGLFDLVRMDHFRGLVSCWAIPQGEQDASKGEWLPTPGVALLEAIGTALGGLPLLAEDLGYVNEEEVALRDRFCIPGMRIALFGWDGNPDNMSKPSHYPPCSVAYTGNHDTDTVRGWFASASEEQRSDALQTLGTDEAGLPWAMVDAVLASGSDLAILPMQDLLGLGAEARMNNPWGDGGNWTWRAPAGSLTPELAGRLRHGTEAGCRCAGTQAEAVAS